MKWRSDVETEWIVITLNLGFVFVHISRLANLGLVWCLSLVVKIKEALLWLTLDSASEASKEDGIIQHKAEPIAFENN